MKELLKIVTCGSVDDGKSTLIGRLLYDAHLLLQDQEAALLRDSRTRGKGGEPELSFLLDGLIAEREQGITIDVAYRYFATKKRSFIVADAPGHEEYTRNMAVGASFADLALLLLDASKGIRTQTRRHLKILSLFGVRHFVFAVNKMDLVSYSEEVFQSISADLSKLAEAMPVDSLAMIPVSALYGENVTEASAAMPWYDGPALLPYLEDTEIREVQKEGTVLPVQRVAKTKDRGRFVQGTLACGSIHTGDVLTVLPSGTVSRIVSILAAGKAADCAFEGEAVAVQLADEIDNSRGSVLVQGCSLKIGERLISKLLWMDDQPLLPGKRYRMKLSSEEQTVSTLQILYKEEMEEGRQAEDGGRRAADSVVKNEIAVVEFASSSSLVFDSFEAHPALGRYILIDPVTDETAGAGVILCEEPGARAEGKEYQAEGKEKKIMTRSERAALLGQTPRTLWMTGLSGAGKTALSRVLEKEFALRGMHSMLLDGDELRRGLNQDLGFTKEDRSENIRRIAETARLLNDAGLIVIVSAISPFEEDRMKAREIIGEESFIEIYVNTPLEECEKRDAKGLYRKVREGLIPDFTGISSPYEPPAAPDITIDTSGRTEEEAGAELLRKILEML